MLLTDQALWARIAAHPMPATSDGTSFLRQLVDEYSIKVETAERAIEEYRRFLYLSALGKGRTVPTKAVDKVWHLHLTHSRDYWEKLVPETLGGRKVHHTPGAPEGHWQDFDTTRDRYIAEFGEEPPKGFWQRRTRRTLMAKALVELVFSVTTLIALAAFGVSIVVLLTGLTVVGLYCQWSLWTVWQNKANNDAQIEIEIWADGDAGDCGADCGGGCGD